MSAENDELFIDVAQPSGESYPLSGKNVNGARFMKNAISVSSRRFLKRAVCLLAIAGYASMPMAQQRLYGIPNSEDIANALAKPKPLGGSVSSKPLTRGLMLEKQDSEERVAEQRPSEQKGNTGVVANSSSSNAGGGKAAGIFLPAAPEVKQATSSRAVDLEIQFAFGSDRLTADGRAVLDQLGAALRSEALSDVTGLVLEGHTDAIGNPQSNLALSLRRAKAAQVYLTQRHRINPNAIQALGKGATELAAPSNPADGINRRVRVIVEG